MINMNPKYFYAYEKFLEAIRVMAIDKGDIKQRLNHAYYFIHPIRDKHLPPSLHTDFNELTKLLNKFGPITNSSGDIIKGSVEETLNRIKLNTGSKIAKHIFNIYIELNRMYINGK